MEVYLYWGSTALLVLLYLTSSTMYVLKRTWVRQSLAELGYPGYLVSVLTVIKLLAVAAVLARVNIALSDLAYAGMFYHLSLAVLAHLGVRKPGAAMPAMLGMVLLSISFATQNAARDLPSPYLKELAVRDVATRLSVRN